MIPSNFDVQINQQQPFEVKLRIGQNIVFLGVAAILAAIYYKKAR